MTRATQVRLDTVVVGRLSFVLTDTHPELWLHSVGRVMLTGIGSYQRLGVCVCCGMVGCVCRRRREVPKRVDIIVNKSKLSLNAKNSLFGRSRMEVKTSAGSWILRPFVPTTK